jgi:N-methylhydantoinase A
VARTILNISSAKIKSIIDGMIKDYKLNRKDIKLIGGGGGAAAIVPFTSMVCGMDHIIAPDHAVISAIGAALAMVTETIERSTIDPTDADILKIRCDAEAAVLGMGACQETVEVTVEVDRQKNVLRATACGATEMRKKDLLVKELNEDSRKKAALVSMGSGVCAVKLAGQTEWLDAWLGEKISTKVFGLLSKKSNPVAVTDREGIVRLFEAKGNVIVTDKERSDEALKNIFLKYVSYSDAGKSVPGIYALKGAKIIDLTKLCDTEQITAVFKAESVSFGPDDTIVFIVVG